MPASVGGIEVVEVVTRYGAKHLAIKNRFDDAMSRHFTACMGTSSWTIESWAANPDHPLGLTADAMVGLDLCTRCVAILRPESPTTRLPVETRHPEAYVLVDIRGHAWVWRERTWRTASGEDCQAAVAVLNGEVSDGGDRDPA